MVLNTNTAGRPSGSGSDLHRLAAHLRPGRTGLAGGGGSPGDEVDKPFDPDTGDSRPAKHGNEPAAGHRGPHQALKLLRGGLRALQVLLQQLVVGLNRQLDKLLVPVLSLIGQQIDNPGKVGLGPNRPGHRLGAGTEPIPHIRQSAVKGGVLPVEPVDEHHPGQPGLASLPPQDDVPGLHPAH